MIRCEKCGESNCFYYVCCKKCGNKLNNDDKEAWGQYGCDSESSFTNIGDNSGYKIDFLLGRKYRQEVSKNQILPSPIMANDLLVYYNPCEKTFEALEVSEENIEAYSKARSNNEIYENIENVKWVCDFSDYIVNESSTPVAYDGYLYVVSFYPAFLHRISLNNGHREILSLRLPEKMAFELASDGDEIIKNCAPIMLSKVNDVIGNKTCLLVFTSKKVWYIDISDNSFDENTSSLKAKSFSQIPNVENMSRPVKCGNEFVATISNPSGILCYDISNLPYELNARKISPSLYKNINNDFASLSGCVFSKCCSEFSDGKHTVLWFAFSKSGKKISSIRFTSLKKIDVKTLDLDFDYDDIERNIPQPLFLQGTGFVAYKRFGNYKIYKNYGNKRAAEETEFANFNDIDAIDFNNALPISYDKILMAQKDKFVVVDKNNMSDKNKLAIQSQNLTLISHLVKYKNIMCAQTNTHILLYKIL